MAIPTSTTTLGDTFLRGQRLLVVAPHPDDEVLGCAGTIARVKSLGGQAYVMVVSAGGIAQHGRAADGRGTAVVPGDVRCAELAAAMAYLDVDGHDVLYPDDATHQRLDTVPQRELVDRISHASPLALEVLRPTMLLLPARSFNADHVAVFRACLAATRPSAPGVRHTVPVVLAYDNTTAFWSVPDERFDPAVYVDITDHLETKLAALALHRSQARPGPFHASPEGVRTVAAYYGGHVSVAAAEAFQLLRLAL